MQNGSQRPPSDRQTLSTGCMTFFIIISKIYEVVKICVSFKTIQQEVNVSEKLFGFVFIFMLIHVKKGFQHARASA